MLEEDFWNNKEKSLEVLKKLKELKNLKGKYTEIIEKFENIEVLIDFIKQGEEEFIEELTEEISKLKESIDDMTVKILLNGKYDNNSAIITINSGAGGVESFDYVRMLFEMYDKWAKKHDYKLEIIDYLDGEEAGFKNITFLIEGEYIYGLLKAERGIHRMVRISPFDANKRRHTTFAAVNVLPNLDNDISINIDSSEIEIDTYRASGAGGQHVNTTDSAVRIKHLKTGIVVTCQKERSQMKNKEYAMKILKSKLLELEIEKQNNEINEIKGNEDKIEWGYQIRSYVMQPYELVKDHRTKYEEYNVENVLNGNIDEFIKNYLKETIK